MPDLTPTSTIFASNIQKHILTLAQYEQLVSQGYVLAHPYEEYYITDVSDDSRFAHTANTVISAATTTITFAAGQRRSQMIAVSGDLAIDFAVNNLMDNRLWIKNDGGVDANITIGTVTCNGIAASHIYTPAGGIAVPTGNIRELGVIANSDGVFITLEGVLV